MDIVLKGGNMKKTQEEQLLYLEEKLKEKDQLIAELQQQVFYLDHIISFMPGHVYWLDKNNVYLGCNDLQAKNLNLASRNDIVGKTNFDLIGATAATLNNELNTKVMHTGASHIAEEISDTILGKRNFLSHKAPLRNIQGEVIGVLGVSLDITARKKAEKELKEAKEKAELTSQVKTEFLKNMSHDLRTPFSGILGFTKILMKQEQDPNKLKKINYIKEASESLVKLLNEIIEMSCIEQRGIPINKINFNLKQLINELVHLVDASVKFKNLDLLVEYQDDIPAEFFGDKVKLHRILLNLIGNAIRFTEKGLIRLIINYLKKTDFNGELIIVVEDTGVGISPDKFKVIFEQFTRLSSEYTDICVGAGLGLYIVKKFINELKGDIQVASEVGKGSRFTCKIPLRVSQGSSAMLLEEEGERNS